MRVVRWGILGSGVIAGLFADGLRAAPGARLEAVASRSAAAAQEFGRDYGIRVHADYAALVADPAIDVVYVATPNECHREHSLMAIAAGKAVLCEKPFALNVTQGREMIEAARARGVFCMEAMWMRCSPALHAVLAELGSGKHGRARFLSAQLGFPNTPDGSSRLFAPPGGGALLDLGVYPLALAQAVFGRPRRVQATAAFGDSGVDESVSILLEYDDARHAAISASLRTPLENSATIHAEDAVIGLDPLYFPLRYTATRIVVQGQAKRRGKGGGRQRLQNVPLARPALALARRLRHSARTNAVSLHPAGGGYAAEAVEVMRCLSEGLTESPQMPHEDTLAVLDTLDAIRRVWRA